MNIFFNFFLSLFFVLFLAFGLQFFRENELRASKISLGSSFFFGLLFLLFYFVEVPFNENLEQLFTVFILIFTIVLLFPFRAKGNFTAELEKEPFDERDVMFSRNELIPGSKRFSEYYQRHPEKRELDDKFRSKAGLMSEKATQYHPLKFAAADANFQSVESFVPYLQDNALGNEKISVDAGELSHFIKKWMKQVGVLSIGVSELKEYHLYSIKGRREEYGNPVVQNHRFAIAFTVEMDKDMIDFAPAGEAIMESSQQYFRSAAIAAQLTRFIRNLGYSARPHFDGNYQLVVGLVARDAGLGDYGRMGLLMTPELGARARIAVVTTDIPLLTDEYKPMPSMVDFCVLCKKCADNCPTRAISFDLPKKENNFERWTINHEACFTYWNITGTDCGKCIQVCPYSHPSNFMHNSIRAGIKNSVIFSRFALNLDDIFYGRKVKRKTNPSPVE